MAHEFEQGFFVRKPAWHELGKVLASYPGRDEAMKLAGHGFKVLESTVHTERGYEIEGWKYLARSDSGAVLSVVKDSYQPIQNEVLWDVLDAIVNEPNIQYETAGVLKQGRLVWALAKLCEPWTVPGDNSETLPYVNVGLGHDGETPLEAWLTSIRTVCANTYAAGLARAQKSGLYFSFKHTKNVMDRIESARTALKGIRAAFEEYKTMTTALAEHKVDKDGVQKFMTTLIPDVEVIEEQPIAQENVEEARKRYAEFLQGITIPDFHRRTAYGLWCAGIEYMDYGRKARTAETLFTRCVSPSPEKSKLAELALSV